MLSFQRLLAEKQIPISNYDEIFSMIYVEKVKVELKKRIVKILLKYL